jgi:hypothetical protein
MFYADSDTHARRSLSQSCAQIIQQINKNAGLFKLAREQQQQQRHEKNREN